MLNLDRLRALHAVSAHGSIIAAAETLNVTTSAVSQQLAKLEAETGQTLLERHGRGVRLTDAAAALVLRTQRVLSLLEEAEAELEANETAVAGQITIAAFATAARGLAPQAIRALRKKYPQLGDHLSRAGAARLDPAPGAPRRRPDHHQRLAERADRPARRPDQGAAV